MALSSQRHDLQRYFAYDANLATIVPSDCLTRRRGKPCPYYPAKAVGDPMFDVRRYLERPELPPAPRGPSQGTGLRALIATLLVWFGCRIPRIGTDGRFRY